MPKPEEDAGDAGLADAPGAPTRAGDIALVGRPNVGKSTLLNLLIGERLSIVTPRAQTTREAVTGILTTADSQLIFVDTPGLLDPSYTLQRAMLETALSVLRDADLALLLLDATRPEEVPSGAALEALQSKGEAVYVAINKLDVVAEAGVAALHEWSRREMHRDAVEIAASTGAGTEALLAALRASLPESPFFYPEDDLAVQPVRFFVAEMIRETIFEEYEEEVPYASVAAIDEYREETDPIFIRATIYVERESQKGILVGRAGAGIKRLGERSRAKIEAFVGGHVYLDLRVKALPNWRKKVSSLQYLGFPVPESMRSEVSDSGKRMGRKQRQRSRRASDA
jgi:GTP-binding protein Era